MRRIALIGTLALGLLVLFAVPALGLSSAGETNAQALGQEDIDEDATAPGEQLSGVIGMSEAELEGDLEQRTFGVKMAQAATADAQADIVGTQLAAVEDRLNDLEDQKAELEEKREAGEITEGQYRAGIATLAAQTSSAAQLTNQSEQAAGGLPTELLEERGIDVEGIQTLREQAHELSGPEVADIARDIGGPGVGEHPVHNRTIGPPGNVSVGPPDNASLGPPDNRSIGPPDNASLGPPDNASLGPPDNRSIGPPDNRSAGPPGNDSAGPPGDDDAGPPGDDDAGPPGDDDAGPPGDDDPGPPGDDDPGPPGDDDPVPPGDDDPGPPGDDDPVPPSDDDGDAGPPGDDE